MSASTWRGVAQPSAVHPSHPGHPASASAATTFGGVAVIAQHQHVGVHRGHLGIVQQLPSFTSHIIAALTLAIPGTILGETALSFLGLGLREPAISWGVLLQDAQNVQTVALSPWLLLPGRAADRDIMAFNFLGDGLRDAADPYGR